MNIEYVSSRKMGTAGSILIDAIQNSHTPCLDLFVRESIQNSLDAADINKTTVKVQFLVKDFQSSHLSKYFDDITDVLDTRYGSTNQDLLVVRDSNTVGLTGPVRTEGLPISEFGNFYKLVYDINKKQNQEGAGGAWGIGKTVYFRLGIGLVIYYTRIRNGNAYEERLAAALVEDESESNRHHILPSQKNKTRRGIAWWGQLDPDEEGSTIPVTDEKLIHEILNSVGVEPYSNTETGTTVIIPYLKTSDLLKELKYDNNCQDAPPWCNGSAAISLDASINRSSLVRYLDIAVKKWYTPRMSKSYSGNRLVVKINDDILKLGDEKIFVLMDMLYSARPESSMEFDGQKINSVALNLQSTFVKDNMPAGWINYVKVRESAFDTSPYYYLFNYRDPDETVLNSPIFMCCRKPGMIVSFEQSGLWLKNVQETPRDEYLISFFVPNSNKILANNNMIFDEYLRKGEQSDHMTWVDSIRYGNLRIVTRLQNHVSNTIRKTYEASKGTDRVKHKANWGKAFASKLLPPNNFSRWDDGRGGLSNVGGTEGGKTTGSKPNTGIKVKKSLGIKVKHVEFAENSIILKAQLNLGNKPKLILGINIVSESGNVSCEKWEKQMDTPYPISLNYVKVLQLLKQTTTKDFVKSKESHLIEDDIAYDYISYSFARSVKDGHKVAMVLTPDKADYYIIDCEISYSLNGVKGNVFFKEME